MFELDMGLNNAAKEIRYKDLLDRSHSVAFKTVKDF